MKRYDKNETIILGGHNINFDVNFLKVFLQKNNRQYKDLFSHRTVDTATILYYLYLAGKIKQKSISSSQAFSLFNITVPKRHTAIGDAIATTELFNHLLKLISKNSKIGKYKFNLPNLFE